MKRHIPYLYRRLSQPRCIQASLREIRRPGDKLFLTTRQRWWTRELRIFSSQQTSLVRQRNTL